MKKPWVLGTGVALLTTLCGIVLVLLLVPGDDQAEGTGSDPTGTERSASKSNGSATSTTTTTVPAGATATLPSTGPTPPTTEEPEPPDPPDPADAFGPVPPLPAGVSATLDSCGWNPANGGQLVASGTLTNSSGEDEYWLITVYWLFRNVNQDEEFDEETEIFDLEVGQSIPWQIALAAPLAPPNLSCVIEVE